MNSLKSFGKKLSKWLSLSESFRLNITGQDLVKILDWAEINKINCSISIQSQRPGQLLTSYTPLIMKTLRGKAARDLTGIKVNFLFKIADPKQALIFKLTWIE